MNDFVSPDQLPSNGVEIEKSNNEAPAQPVAPQAPQAPTAPVAPVAPTAPVAPAQTTATEQPAPVQSVPEQVTPPVQQEPEQSAQPVAEEQTQMGTGKVKTEFVRIVDGSEINHYLNGMMADDATDIYITVGVPVTYRIENEIHQIGTEPLTEENIRSILEYMTTEKQMLEFDKSNELNCGLDRGEIGRFRINAMRQRQKTALVIRKITSTIPTFEDLNLPPVMANLASEKRGLVLIVGVTSSGKSTSLAAMIDYRNSTLGGHIITIENPVEYYHDHKKGIVNQREVGADTDSFHVALKNALRQKPDVILVGEIRDAEVMEQAIIAAETGHLCYATLHTANAAQAVDRIINFFPEDRQDQIRIALAMNLRAVVAQRLIKRKGGGMVVVPEVMLNEALIKDLILKGETNKIRDVMANNVSAGMSTFDMSLFNLFKQDMIAEETLIHEAELQADMKIRLQEYKTTDEYKSRFAGEGEQGSDGTGEAGGLSIDTSGLSLS